jgi:hypothetical protein
MKALKYYMKHFGYNAAILSGMVYSIYVRNYVSGLFITCLLLLRSE